MSPGVQDVHGTHGGSARTVGSWGGGPWAWDSGRAGGRHRLCGEVSDLGKHVAFRSLGFLTNATRAKKPPLAGRLPGRGR